MRYFISALFMISCQITFAQNTSSPYSVLGIGDIDGKDNNRYASSGNAAVARRDNTTYNFSNPASITALPLKLMNFDIVSRARFSSYASPVKSDTSIANSKDMVIRKIAMAFKVDRRNGFAFGLKPYSTVNYQVDKLQTILDGNSYYYKSVEGNGGLNQVYFSFAREMSKHFSAGITVSYLFGSMQRETAYLNSFINITRKDIRFYYGAIGQLGFQYYSSADRLWRHNLGFTFSMPTSLNGQATVDYLEQDSVLTKSITSSTGYKLPVSAALGYSVSNDYGWTISAEGQYDYWKKQKVDYANSFTTSSYRLGIGAEYALQNKPNSPKSKPRPYVAFGAQMQNGYLLLNGRHILDRSATLGAGTYLLSNMALNASIELGKRGSSGSGQIVENYTQFQLGLSIKQFWVGSKINGRYR